MLHGAYASMACVHLLYKRELTLCCICTVINFVKIGLGNSFGGMGTAQLIGSPVLVEAHLLGVIWGIVLAVIYVIGSYFIAEK